MQSTLKTNLQLALLKKLRDKKNPLQKGFTLVELMIVVAVVGILSAVALPAFLGARNAADAGAKVGEALGIAKECATFLVSQVGTAPSDCSAGSGTISRTFTAGAVGVKCLTATSSSADTVVNVSVASNGGLSCGFAT